MATIRTAPLVRCRRSGCDCLGARGRSYPSVTHTRVAMRTLTLAASGGALTSPGGVAPRGVPLLAASASSANKVRAIVGRSSRFNACCGPAQSIGARCARASRSFSTHLLASLAIALCMAWSHGHAAEISPTSALPADQAALLEEYRTNYRRLVDCYENIQMEVVGHFTPAAIPGVTQQPDTKTHFIYRSNGGQFFRMDAARLRLEDESHEGTMTVTIVRPEGCFAARRSRRDGPFVPTLWSANGTDGMNAISDFLFPWSPYTCIIQSMKSFVLDRRSFTNNTSEKVEAHEIDGERLVTFTVTSNAGPADRVDRFVFLRDHSWALKEYQTGPADPRKIPNMVTFKAKYNYEGIHDGVPLLKRFECREERLDPPLADRYVYEVRTIVPGPVPECEFLPEAAGIKVGHQSEWIASTMLGLSGMFLVTGFVTVRRRKQQAKSSPRADPSTSGGAAIFRPHGTAAAVLGQVLTMSTTPTDQPSLLPSPWVWGPILTLLASMLGGGALAAALLAPDWHALVWVGLVPFALLLSPRCEAAVAYPAAFLAQPCFTCSPCRGCVCTCSESSHPSGSSVRWSPRSFAWSCSSPGDCSRDARACRWPSPCRFFG